jgi:hypothetical protein
MADRLLDSTETREVAAQVRQMVQKAANEAKAATGISLSEYAAFAATRGSSVRPMVEGSPASSAARGSNAKK